MTKYQNILVAVDGSDAAKLALTRALEIAVENDAHVVITYVVEAMENLDCFLISKIENYGRAMIERYKKEAKQFGVKNVTTVIEFGSPRSKIPKSIAKEYQANLIVAGANGLNAVERLFIGSVSEAITRHAPCDVLIVRNGQGRQSKSVS